MNNKPIIGIVGRPGIKSNEEKVISIGEYYRLAVVKKGGIPVLILPNQNSIYESTNPHEIPRMTESEKNDLRKIIDMCDGILMQGGNEWYEYDEFICNYAINKNIPLLGICLGMQLMGKVDTNNETASDISIKNNTNINHDQKGIKYVHKVNIDKDSLLYKIIGKHQIEVNSTHNYHIENTNKFKISAYSEDGLIEALELPNNIFTIGVQWHPEKMLEYDESANKIIETFIEKSKKR